MKNILVATDLSIRSDRAVARAVRLAAALGARLTAISVTDAALPNDIAETVVRQTDARLTRMLADLAERRPCDWAVSATLGDPVEDILDAAEAVRADLVVLGLHRPRSFLDGLRETTMERLVRGTRIAVLLVRDAADHDYSRVLVPVDFSPGSTAALASARALAPAAECTAFHAVHIAFGGVTGAPADDVYTLGFVREAERARAAWIAAGGLADGVAEPLIIEGSFGEVLARQLASHPPDLLAMGAHARAVPVPWLLGGIAADLVRDPPSDLLIARPALG